VALQVEKSYRNLELAKEMTNTARAALDVYSKQHLNECLRFLWDIRKPFSPGMIGR